MMNEATSLSMFCFIFLYIVCTGYSAVLQNCLYLVIS